jgi:hypothetical protein
MLTRSVVRRCAAATAAGDNVSLEAAVARMRKQAHVRYALATTSHEVVTTSGFIALARGATSHVPEQMTHGEAVAYLRALHAAKLVVFNEADDVVHLRPADLLAEATGSAVPGTSAAASASEAKAEEADAILATSAATKAARFRRRFWSAVAVGSGLQMTAMSYLTFVMYGWDDMEPPSYFLTTGTGLVFYAWFLFLRREHSYTDLDRTVLANKFAAKAATKRTNESLLRAAASDKAADAAADAAEPAAGKKNE